MLRQKVRRLANPRRRKRVKAKARPKSVRRRRTRRAQANPVKRRRKVVTRRRNKVHARKRTVTRRRRQTRENPALVVTLGALGNPHRKRRKKVMATRRRRKARKNPARRRARRNTRIVVVAPRRRRRANSHRRRSNTRLVHHHRRNPASVFGHSGIRNIGTVVVGGLVGVAAAKFLPTLVPAQFQLGGGNIMRTVITGAAAFAAAWVAKRFMPQISDAVLFGGLMQTASVGLNAFLPSLGRQIGLNGMGYLSDGHFVVPQNPIRILPPASPVPTGARVTVNGLHRAFSQAF